MTDAEALFGPLRAREEVALYGSNALPVAAWRPLTEAPRLRALDRAWAEFCAEEAARRARDGLFPPLPPLPPIATEADVMAAIQRSCRRTEP